MGLVHDIVHRSSLWMGYLIIELDVFDMLCYTRNIGTRDLVTQPAEGYPKSVMKLDSAGWNRLMGGFSSQKFEGTWV